MPRISEQISYLSGLCEGLNITEDTPQGKVLLAIIDVLDTLNDEISQVDFDLVECQNQLEEMDDQLCYMDKLINDNGTSDEIIEFECSKCGEELYFNADILEDEDSIEIICPTCQEVVYIHEGAYDYDPSYIESDIDDHVWFGSDSKREQ
ncbi:MAG: AraC family transcriptional regulator [Syntrophomonadaceae bacterium]|nr:AraC family transcriptional regulator [Syntrophomonadaceae bacterium]